MNGDMPKSGALHMWAGKQLQRDWVPREDDQQAIYAAESLSTRPFSHHTLKLRGFAVVQPENSAKNLPCFSAFEKRGLKLFPNNVFAREIKKGHLDIKYVK